MVSALAHISADRAARMFVIARDFAELLVQSLAVAARRDVG
jgi:hypothetical protein